MKAAIIILGILILQISCSSSGTENKVNSHLKENYEIDWNKVESVSLNERPVYYEKNNPPKLEKLEVDLLEQKTGYEFNKTILSTGHMEYPELMMIIAVPKSDKEEIKELESPTFTDISQDFMNIFEGIKIASDEEKNKLVEQISSLFKEITYKGAIKKIKESSGDYSSELWHGRLKWRILNFDFEKGKLMKIEFVNPKSSFSKIENE